MIVIKSKYRVFVRCVYKLKEKYIDAHKEKIIFGKWRQAGETMAVSEKQAINNVRYNEWGEYESQYEILYGPHYDTSYQWVATWVAQR